MRRLRLHVRTYESGASSFYWRSSCLFGLFRGDRLERRDCQSFVPGWRVGRVQPQQMKTRTRRTRRKKEEKRKEEGKIERSGCNQQNEILSVTWEYWEDEQVYRSDEYWVLILLLEWHWCMNLLDKYHRECWYVKVLKSNFVLVNDVLSMEKWVAMSGMDDCVMRAWLLILAWPHRRTDDESSKKWITWVHSLLDWLDVTTRTVTVTLLIYFYFLMHLLVFLTRKGFTVITASHPPSLGVISPLARSLILDASIYSSRRK